MKQIKDAGSTSDAVQENGRTDVSKQNLAGRWHVVMKKCERSGLLYAAGFGMGLAATQALSA
ncbi:MULTISPECIES: hypothetical protein [Pseudomonas]|uniref:hypothetical protein n=1 Tax=Pseudomonas TaxID=286 RepID=UPI000789CF26|nr:MULTISPECIES: hypothetical protein [Pseudomonas]AMS13135.1 hypothetical protein A3218_01945 [Pseudomonas chlororaphis]